MPGGETNAGESLNASMNRNFDEEVNVGFCHPFNDGDKFFSYDWTNKGRETTTATYYLKLVERADYYPETINFKGKTAGTSK